MAAINSACGPPSVARAEVLIKRYFRYSLHSSLKQTPRYVIPSKFQSSHGIEHSGQTYVTTSDGGAGGAAGAGAAGAGAGAGAAAAETRLV